MSENNHDCSSGNYFSNLFTHMTASSNAVWRCFLFYYDMWYYMIHVFRLCILGEKV